MRRGNHTLVSALLVWALATGACAPQVARGLDEAGIQTVTEAVASAESETDEAETPESEPTVDDVATVDETNELQAPADGAETVTPQDDADSFEESVEAVEGDSAKPEEKPSEAEEAVEAEDADEQVVLTAASTVKEADAFAAKHAGTIVDGTYAITSSLGTGFALDVRGASKSNGAQVISWKVRTAYNQRWVIRNVGGGYVTIKSVNSGKYLQAGYKGKAYFVAQNAWSSSERGQLWIVCKESGYYKFVSAADLNRVLVVSGGTGAKTGYACYSYLEEKSVAANRRWTVTATAAIQDAQATAHKSDIEDGIYYVCNEDNPMLALTVKGSSFDNSAAAILYSNVAKTSQGWKVTHDSKGYVTFVNVRSGKALDVRGASAKPGASIIQWTKKTGARNQKWIVAKNPSGTYTIASALTGQQLVLGVSGASSSAATKLVTVANASVQQWRFTKTSAHFAHLADLPDGSYLIRTQLDTKKVLDVAGSSKKSGTVVKLWDGKNGANQTWTVSHDVYGFVHLKNKNSGLHLAYENDRLVQSSKAYKWIILKSANGSYRIRDGSSAKYLEVKGSNTNNTTNQVVFNRYGTGKNQLWSVTSPVIAISKDMAIMGESQITQAQAVNYIKSTYAKWGWSLPKKWRDDGETVEKIVSYFWQEGADEGVRGDIAIAQSFQETGVFQFGGNVLPEQYNFAGMGVTGYGNRGNSFKDARTGVRAQIQHLKAYASTKDLNKACVDPRFDLVERGCAPTIAGLSGTWAADPGYATAIVDLLNAMLR